jgi:hypothetical protein
MLRDLKARASQQKLRADFEADLDGFSPNVQDILDKFEFRNQIPRLSKADALGTLIEKFLSPDIDLSPSGLDNRFNVSDLRECLGTDVPTDVPTYQLSGGSFACKLLQRLEPAIGLEPMTC